MQQELVRNWMTPDPITITPETTFPTAELLMAEHNIRRLPVVDANGRLLGIVTRGDIRGADVSNATSIGVWELNYALAKLQVGKIMTRNPLSIGPEATLGAAAKLMLEHKISGLPVLDAAEMIVGIITESDIFRAVVQAWHQAEEKD